jgi:thiol-disulfide isomerase/thioredoxin
VSARRTHAGDAGRQVVVYVGASWCEPCTRFHDAVAAGELDDAFPDVDFLEFDLDRDGRRLREAGYFSRLIPLFAVPRADGRAHDDPNTRLSGSIKGPRAVANIRGRLGPLLSNYGGASAG